MKNCQKWPKVNKNIFFKIKIDLQLRFDMKNVLTIKINAAFNTQNFIGNF
jgi:hypothetical protein